MHIKVKCEVTNSAHWKHWCRMTDNAGGERSIKQREGEGESKPNAED